jgi:hypothetical protein
MSTTKLKQLGKSYLMTATDIKVLMALFENGAINTVLGKERRKIEVAGERGLVKGSDLSASLKNLQDIGCLGCGLRKMRSAKSYYTTGEAPCRAWDCLLDGVNYMHTNILMVLAEKRCLTPGSGMTCKALAHEL